MKMASSRTREREEVLMSEKCQTLVAEGDAIQQDPIAQQHELLVSEIESTDGHLGTALRFVVLTVVVINLPNLVFSFKTVYNTGARHKYYPCMGSRFPVLFGSGILSIRTNRKRHPSCN